MVGVSKAISESLYLRVEAALKEVSKNGDVSRKLQAIKSAKEHGIKAVADIFGVSRVAIMSWIKDFDKHGISGLQLKTGRGRKHTLTDVEKEEVRNLILADCNVSIIAVKDMIWNRFSKKLGRSATHNLMKGLKFSYITPRPIHYKQDKTLLPTFKKKSKKCSE
jgi:transposase